MTEGMHSRCWVISSGSISLGVFSKNTSSTSPIPFQALINMNSATAMDISGSRMVRFVKRIATAPTQQDQIGNSRAPHTIAGIAIGMDTARLFAALPIRKEGCADADGIAKIMDGIGNHSHTAGEDTTNQFKHREPQIQ